MKPDWKPVLPDDPVYDAGMPKWAADQYGCDDLRSYPNGGTPIVGPDDREAPYWTITVVPNARATSPNASRFIAYRTVPTPPNFL